MLIKCLISLLLLTNLVNAQINDSTEYIVIQARMDEVCYKVHAEYDTCYKTPSLLYVGSKSVVLREGGLSLRLSLSLYEYSKQGIFNVYIIAKSDKMIAFISIDNTNTINVSIDSPLFYNIDIKYKIKKVGDSKNPTPLIKIFSTETINNESIRK